MMRLRPDRKEDEPDHKGCGLFCGLAAIVVRRGANSTSSSRVAGSPNDSQVLNPVF